MVTSAHAKRNWYYGLTPNRESDPVLIARSSTSAFRYENHPFYTYYPYGPEMPKRKVMSVIGHHPIMAIYDDHLRPRVREALATIKWQTIDIVRLGYEGELDNPPVTLITIAPEDAEENVVQDAVDEIRNIMVE